MQNLEKLGHHSLSNRDLYLIERSSPEASNNLQVNSPHFVALIIWDATDSSAATVAKLANTLLDSGCSYICTWGADCERVHDICDEQIIERMPNSSESSTILTTWHTEDNLNEVLYYFLYTTWPADNYFETSRSGVVITINAMEAHTIRIRAVLKTPESLEID